MAAPVYLLEFSRDNLADTTPTYIDITAYLLEASYTRDGGGDLDDPQAGTMTVVLNNRSRRFEPEYAAGAYYPDIKPLRRMRLSIDGDIEFTGFVSSWGPQFPDSLFNQEAVVTVVDGWHLAELETLPALDPSDAETYDDVIAFDEPWGHWGLGDPPGTKVRVKNTRKRTRVVNKTGAFIKTTKHKRKHIVTRSEAEGSAGPSGTYKGLPTLGVPGLILGDSDTAVSFASASSQYARIGPIEEDDLINTNRISVEAWIKTTSFPGGADPFIVSGPLLSAISDPVFYLWCTASGARFTVENTTGITQATGIIALSTATTYHIVGTWDGTRIRVYVNGVLDDEVISPRAIAQGDSGEYVRIGTGAGGTAASYFDGVTDEVAIYEKELTPERILAHYYAGAQRGWSQQTAGNRLVSILTHDLWGTGSIQTTGLDVQPQMQHGQTLVDEVSQTAEPLSVRYFSGAGNPVYLGWDFGDASPYNTVQATFGDSGSEVPYEDIDLDYDETIYNDVSVTRDEGETQASSDSDSQDEFRTRGYQRTGLILSEDGDTALVADTIVDMFKQPALTVRGITLNGLDPLAMAQILAREPGQLVRVKRRPVGGTAIDRVCRVKSKSVSIPRGGPREYPTCTLTFSRGFDASLTQWHLGIVGFGELNTGTALA